MVAITTTVNVNGLPTDGQIPVYSASSKGFIWNSGQNIINASQHVFNVLDYGADSTGVADSYAAFQAWSQAITAAGGGQGLVPPGTYKIDQYVTTTYAGGYSTPIRDFEFKDCHGLKLSGYGAKINIKGDVHRQADWSSGPYFYAFNRPVQPFEIFGCTNVEVEGFEVNGNAQLVIDDAPGIVEGAGNLISIAGCTNVFLHNLKLHHAWNDGISSRSDRRQADLGNPPRIASRRIAIEACEVYACARSNVSVHEIQFFRMSNVSSYNAGITGGMISFSPGTAVDIEPDPVAVDIGTATGSSYAIFDNCEFYNCLRPFTANVRFAQLIIRNCRLKNENSDQQPMVLSIPQLSISDCDIDTGTGRIDIGLSGTLPGMNVFTMERCLIKASSGEGLIVAPTAGRVAQAYIANNRFICNTTVPRTNGKRFPSVSYGDPARYYMTGSPNLTFTPAGGSGATITRSSGSWITDGFGIGSIVTVRGAVASGGYNNVTGTIASTPPPTATVITLDTTNLINEGPIGDCVVYANGGLLQGAFVDNYVFIPTAALDTANADAHGGVHTISDIGLHHISNNVYETDYNAPAAFPNRCFGILYSIIGPGPGSLSLATNERFVSPNNLGFRPASQTDHNCILPYATGKNAIGNELIIASKRVVYSNLSPTDGSTYSRGDIVHRVNPFIGESPGWVCNTPGTAGGTAVFTPMRRMIPGEDAGTARISFAMQTSGVDTNKVLDPNILLYQMINLTFTLTADRTLTVPAPISDDYAYIRTFRNGTLGGFNIIITTGSGTTITLAQGDSITLEAYSGGVRYLNNLNENKLTGTSTNASVVNLITSGSVELSMSNTKSYLIDVYILGSRTDAQLIGTKKHTLTAYVSGGTLTINDNTLVYDNFPVGWSETISAPSGLILRVSCNGASGQTVKFAARIEWTELGGF
jgi:hypothetical protein